MNVALFLVGLFILLIVYTIVSTIIKFTLFLTTKIKFENIRLIIPVVLSLLLWTVILSLYIITLNNYLEFNVFSKIIEMYLQKQSLIELSKTSIIFLTFYISIGTLLQTFTYFCVNIKLENIFKYMRYYIVKTFKLQSKSKPENIVIKDSIENLNLFSAFLASLLTTILFIIIFTILIIIGLTISKRLVI